MSDVAAFRDACSGAELPVSVERSRSGNGVVLLRCTSVRRQRGPGPAQREGGRKAVSAPETALLPCGEEGLLEGVWRQGGGVETGR